ncbi:hypothetical protein C8F01DRAFT_1380332 [Mycena amicta]|nr:hypothetical protein C8F01DRAFT_1380332 [Mycena amicta]
MWHSLCLLQCCSELLSLLHLSSSVAAHDIPLTSCGDCTLAAIANVEFDLSSSPSLLDAPLTSCGDRTGVVIVNASQDSIFIEVPSTLSCTRTTAFVVIAAREHHLCSHHPSATSRFDDPITHWGTHALIFRANIELDATLQLCRPSSQARPPAGIFLQHLHTHTFIAVANVENDAGP